MTATEVPRPPVPDSGVVLPNLSPIHDPAGVLHGKPIRGMVLENTCDWPVPDAIDFARLKLLGINTLSVYLCSYVDGLHGPNPYLSDDSPTDSDLSLLANTIHAHGMAVEFVSMFYPLGTDYWRGHTTPPNVSAFFKAYRPIVNHWAKVAQSLDVEIFAYGSEAHSLEIYPKAWKTIASDVDARFDGLRTYHTTGYAAFEMNWWKYTDIISISAYFSLASEPLRPVDQLKYVWKTAYIPKLKALSKKFDRRLLISEVGYASVEGTAIKPAQGPRSDYAGSYSQRAQEDAYNALLGVAAQQGKWLRGIVWFRWNVATVAVIDKTFSPKDKSAECAIAQHWAPSSIPVLNTVRLGPACAVANAV